MSRYQMPDRDDEIRELSFDRPGGRVKFLISRRSGFNFSTSYEVINRFFEHEYIDRSASRVITKGGRGETLLYTLPYKLIGGLYGPKKDLDLAASIQAQRNAGIIKKEGNLVLPDLENIREEYHLVLRHYCRGGMARFFKDSFWRFDSWACRARLEFELCTELYRRGLPVPRPLIAREICGSFFITNDIVVEQIPGTRNIAEVLEQEEDITDSLRWSIGSTLAKFFAEGVWHSDLNIRNILVDEQDKCWIIDFDKCEIRNPLSDSDKVEMLERLERSFNKEKRLRELDRLDVDAIMYDIRAAVAYVPDENDILDEDDQGEDEDDDLQTSRPAAESVRAAADTVQPASARHSVSERSSVPGIPAALLSNRDKSEPRAESVSSADAAEAADADRNESTVTPDQSVSTSADSAASDAAHADSGAGEEKADILDSDAASDDKEVASLDDAKDDKAVAAESDDAKDVKAQKESSSESDSSGADQDDDDREQDEKPVTDRERDEKPDDDKAEDAGTEADRSESKEETDKAAESADDSDSSDDEKSSGGRRSSRRHRSRK